MLQLGFTGPLLSTGLMLGTAALAAQQNDTAFDPERRIPVEALEEDFGILRAALEEGHPGLYRYSSETEIDAHFDRLAAEIQGPMTEREFRRIVMEALAGVNDGHTRSNASEGFGEFVDEQPIRLPFKLVLIDGEAYLHLNYSDLGDELLGAWVASIDSRTIAVITEDLFPLMNSDGRVETSKYRRLEGT